MACGGLRVCERDIDSRLLGSHHSVRVVDFACAVHHYASTVTLKDGAPLSVKIGIHTGDVISGVVGETKPQFSLIGSAVNKTSRVCAKCPKAKILISKETHAALDGNSNNFLFQSLQVAMKGIGNETVYTVQKRRRAAHRISNPLGNRADAVRRTSQTNVRNASPLVSNADRHSKPFGNKHMTGEEARYFEEQAGGDFSQRTVSASDTYGVHTDRRLMMEAESE